MAVPGDLDDPRNTQRAKKLDAIAKRVAAFASTSKASIYDMDVSLIVPDDDIKPPSRPNNLNINPVDPLIYSDLILSKPPPDKQGAVDAEATLFNSAATESKGFDPNEDLDWFDLDAVSKYYHDTDIEDTPIEQTDDFAFSVFAVEMAAATRMLRSVCDRFHSIKMRLTKTQLTLSAFDGGAFVAYTLKLSGNPVGLGNEPIAFLLLSSELVAACTASDVVIHIRVNFEAKRAFLKSGDFERPLQLLGGKAYFDRTADLLGPIGSDVFSDIDANILQTACELLRTIVRPINQAQDWDFIVFNDYQAHYQSKQAFGHISNKGLPLERLIIRDRHLSHLSDVLPGMGVLWRTSTQAYEIFGNDRLLFGFEKAKRATGELQLPIAIDTTIIWLGSQDVMAFLAANQTAESASFDVVCKDIGTGPVELKGKKSGGRQVSMIFEGRRESAAANPFTQSVFMHPLIDILKIDKSANISFEFANDFMIVTVKSANDLEVRYTITLPAKSKEGK